MTPNEARALLHAHGKNQDWLAKQLGAHYTTVSRWFSKKELPIKVSAFLAAFASNETRKEAPIPITLPDEIWEVLKTLAAKKGQTLEEYTKNLIEGLGRELALLLLQARTTAAQTVAEEEQPESIMPAPAAMPTPYPANGGIAAHSDAGAFKC